LDSIGIYLHIPFCNQICPYCPYNKEVFSQQAAQAYVDALIKEIDYYAPLLANKPITSFYIGGGTPTTLLGHGIDKVLNHFYKKLNMQCGIHMESHPNHLSKENIAQIKALGTDYLSIGVEALQDRHLKTIERPYTVQQVQEKVSNAVAGNFKCVNIDYIFDLPGQTIQETEEAAKMIVDLGVDQVASYPLFNFPYTRFGKQAQQNRNALTTMFRRRKLLKILEQQFYQNGYERSSVWAFTKKGTDKYCSVSVPSYLGFGASGSSYLKDIFYVNTFNVHEYIKAIQTNKSPIALSVDLSKKMQMSGWLYWRIYETKFSKADFLERFNEDFDSQYGFYMNILKRVGFLKNNENHLQLTDKGTYWIHAFEDFFSIDYINKLWGTSKYDPWPEEVQL